MCQFAHTIFLNYAIKTIIGRVITDNNVDAATSSEAYVALRLYLSARMVLIPADGHAAVITTAMYTVSGALNSFNTNSIIIGNTISLMAHIRYVRALRKRLFKSAFAMENPDISIARGVFILAKCCKVSLGMKGTRNCRK